MIKRYTDRDVEITRDSLFVANKDYIELRDLARELLTQISYMPNEWRAKSSAQLVNAFLKLNEKAYEEVEKK